MNEMIMRDGKLMPVQMANALELKHMAEMMANMAAMLKATTESMDSFRWARRIRYR